MSGHNTPYHMYQGPLLVDDPGDAATIVIDRFGAVVPLVSGASAETRTLAVPTKAGIPATIVFDTDGGGDVTLTVTSGYNLDAETSITFDNAGDYVTFISVKIGANYRWRAIAQEGTTAQVEEGTFDQLTVNSSLTFGASAQSVTGYGVGAKYGATVTAVERGNDIMHKTQLTLASTPVVLADEAGVVAYGGTKLYDFPEGAILILGAVADLSLTINATGVNSNWDGDFGLGTVVADNNNTLTSTEDDILPTTATPQAVSNTVNNCHGQSTAAENVVFDGTSTAVDMYLNILVDDADHDVTNTNTAILASGTITVHWIALGDY